jgi:hypothetical protein
MQVAKLVLVDAQGYTEGVGEMATLPKLLAYTGVSTTVHSVFEYSSHYAPS